MTRIADTGSIIDNTPFVIFLALIAAAVGARWLANHLYDRRRAVEEAMRRHPAGKQRSAAHNARCCPRRPVGAFDVHLDGRLEVDDLQAEWDAYLAGVEAKRQGRS